MSLLNKCSREELKDWRTAAIGCLYLSLHKVLGQIEGAEEQLEVVTEVLDSRPFDEKRELYLEINRQLRDAYDTRNNNLLQELAQVRNHYTRYVFN